MPQSVTITKSIIDHASGAVHLYYDSTGSVVGTNLHAQFSETESPLDDPKWGSDEQCLALATRLGLPVEQVTVATPPEPTDEPTEDTP